MDGDKSQGFVWGFAYHDHVAKLQEWANRNAHDKKAVESAAAKQLTEHNILSEPEAAAVMRALFY